MTKSLVMENFAQQLRAVIVSRGLTMSAAAGIAGMDTGNFSKVINGKEGLTFERAERIASALGLEIDVRIREKRKISVA